LLRSFICSIKRCFASANEDYAKQNKSYGLTTLKNRHAEIDGTEVRFHFVGKSGKQWTTKIRDRRVAKIIRECQELPGQDLLQYRTTTGEIQGISSNDVNTYLKDVTGEEIYGQGFPHLGGHSLGSDRVKGN
jgi:DNA topoisomerase I